jgi:hypothetical protein
MKTQKRRTRRGKAYDSAANGSASIGLDDLKKFQALQAMGLIGKAKKTNQEVDEEDLEEIDISSIGAEQREIFAQLAEGSGIYDLAFTLREGKAPEKGLMTSMKRVGAVNVKVRHIVYAGLIAGALFLVWEGVAYKFDMPRFGLFDSKRR